MPQSLAAVYLHIVFSTKNRDPYLYNPELRSRIHNYIGGTINSLGCQSLIVGGVEDHVHILLRHSRTEAIAKVVGTVKSRSSAWAKDVGRVSGFEWQAGYGAFSVGWREIEIERRYIENQEEHHRKVSFREEYLRMLSENGIEYDEKFLWE